ncbi:hypothetical protein GOFOIKOB_2777 [Methylobacterium tardum]|nr:hypothetical protein GOFOIKOB_2777 [Methylobacterium tardum]
MCLKLFKRGLLDRILCRLLADCRLSASGVEAGEADLLRSTFRVNSHASRQ